MLYAHTIEIHTRLSDLLNAMERMQHEQIHGNWNWNRGREISAGIIDESKVPISFQIDLMNKRNDKMSSSTVPVQGSSQNTSAATFLSSTHGCLRRAQRFIDKRDLQAAVKYGTCEESYNQNGIRRLKYTFADTVYITDETGTKEITIWGGG